MPPTRILRPLTRLAPSLLTQPTHPIQTLLTKRTYATNPPNISPELLDKLRKSPKTLAQVMVLAQIFEKKGLDLSRKPSMMERMKMVTDSEVREELTKTAKVMQEEGFKIGELFQQFGREMMGK